MWGPKWKAPAFVLTILIWRHLSPCSCFDGCSVLLVMCMPWRLIGWWATFVREHRKFFLARFIASNGVSCFWSFLRLKGIPMKGVIFDSRKKKEKKASKNTGMAIQEGKKIRKDIQTILIAITLWQKKGNWKKLNRNKLGKITRFRDLVRQV